MPNGYLSDAALVTVEDDDRLIRATANAFLRMKAAAAATGRPIGIAEPAGAYRSYAVQVDMHRNPTRYNLNPDSTAGLAAPGYSGHGDGNCVDIIGDLKWAVANGPHFGFTRPLRNDPNHFRHDGITAAGGGTSPLEDKETGMEFARDIDNNNALLLADAFHDARWFRRSLMGDQAYSDWTGRYTKLTGEGARMTGEELEFLAKEHNDRAAQNRALFVGAGSAPLDPALVAAAAKAGAIEGARTLKVSAG